MKLSISNLAWKSEHDNQMYQFLTDQKIQAIEIAPTRIFPIHPYECLEEAEKFRDMLIDKYDLSIASIQSIWYGKKENIFDSEESRQALLDYTKKAIDFAAILQCENIVFGCPQNRVIYSKYDYKKAVAFFSELSDHAASRNTVLALEANPIIYNTNFMNNTEEALEMVKCVNSPGCLLNLDLGTVIYNKESLDIVSDNLSFINHIHISEPYLINIKKRELHRNLSAILNQSYNKYVSVEMGLQADIHSVYDTMTYVKEVFHDI